MQSGLKGNPGGGGAVAVLGVGLASLPLGSAWRMMPKTGQGLARCRIARHVFLYFNIIQLGFFVNHISTFVFGDAQGE